MKELKNFLFCLMVAVIGVYAVTLCIPSSQAVEPVKEAQELIDVVIEKDEIVEVANLAVTENVFTEKLEVSDAKHFPLTSIDMPWTRNQLISKIDGKLVVGIQTEKLSFEKEYDEIGNVVTIHVTVPKSQILYEDIQEEVLKQNNGLFNSNPVNVSYYEQKKMELVDKYRNKLVEDKVFEQTDQRVEELITEYLKSLSDENIGIRFSKI